METPWVRTRARIRIRKKSNPRAKSRYGDIKEQVIEPEWQKHERKINGNLITVEVLINGVLFKPILVNTGYKCYSIVDKNLITELRLPRIKILLKLITGFIRKILSNLGWKLRKL